MARVRANLSRFVELALEVDAGRYPSLPRFLERVQQLRGLEKEGPSQATPQAADGQRVCLLTIHAAKGLEAPVVFLADSNSPGSSPPGYQTLVHWPAEADRPSDFMLLSRSRQRDNISNSCYAREQQEEDRESVNLLYVALTRAKNMLVISGCEQSSKKQSSSWYEQMAKAVCQDSTPGERWVHSRGQAPLIRDTEATGQTDEPAIDPRLTRAIPTQPLWQEIAPSRELQDTERESGTVEGQDRGLIIHRMLQLATQTAGAVPEASDIISRVANESELPPNARLVQKCWTEVSNLLSNRDLHWLFTPPAGTRSFNEIPIQYRRGRQTVYGIIDRLLVSDSGIYLIDYKTHRIDSELLVAQLAERYTIQIELYREGVRRLWPGRDITAYLLLTDGGRLVKIENQPSLTEDHVP